jgi:hypothetical protein
MFERPAQDLQPGYRHWAGLHDVAHAAKLGEAHEKARRFRRDTRRALDAFQWAMETGDHSGRAV